MPTGQPDLGDPLLRLSSQVIVPHVKLIMKTNHQRVVAACTFNPGTPEAEAGGAL